MSQVQPDRTRTSESADIKAPWNRAAIWTCILQSLRSRDGPSFPKEYKGSTQETDDRLPAWQRTGRRAHVMPCLQSMLGALSCGKYLEESTEERPFFHGKYRPRSSECDLSGCDDIISSDPCSGWLSALRC